MRHFRVSEAAQTSLVRLRRRREAPESSQPRATPPTPRAPIRAYLADCVINANIELGPDVRLTDLLNSAPTLTIYEVRLYALDDGREVTADEVELDVAEVHAVEAMDKPESRSRHVHTRTSMVEVLMAPYRVVGQIHGPLGGDPAQSVVRRPQMIPLTDVTLQFGFAGRFVTVESEVVIFNRALASSVRPWDES